MNSGLKLLLSFFVLISSVALSQAAEPSDVQAAKELQWNRWTSESFVVHAITNDKGKYLKEHLEDIKKWILDRWGLHQIEFGKETIQTEDGPKEYSHVKLWCIDDPALFEERYGLKDSKVEVLLNSEGKIKNIEVFLLVNDSPAADVPVPLTEAVLAEFEQRHNFKFGWWAHRGMGGLNATNAQIKKNLTDLSKKVSQKIFLSGDLLTLPKDQWSRMNEDEKLLFDQESMVLCLLLRKEFGESRLLHFFKESGAEPEKSLQKIYEFKGYDEFNASFYRYMKQLTDDVAKGVTPNDYLNIKRAGE